MSKNIKILPIVLDRFIYRLKNNSAKMIAKSVSLDINESFNGRGWNGDSWEDLKPYTWKRKKGKNILEETGVMRRSLGIKASKRKVNIKMVSYAKYHLIGTNKMPLRRFLGVVPSITFGKKGLSNIKEVIIKIWKSSINKDGYVKN